MIWPRASLAIGETHDLIADNTLSAIFLHQRTLFDDFVNTVVSKPTDVDALLGYNIIEQFELGITAIHHIEPIGLNRTRQHRPFVMLTATIRRDVDPRRDITINFEMCVKSPLD